MMAQVGAAASGEGITIDWDRVRELEGFGEISARNLKASIDDSFTLCSDSAVRI